MIDLDHLNSATKYPSIETYHALDPKTGGLLETVTPFEGEVVLTEKVDGSNARLIVMPDGDWFIGSREELLYAKGDRIINPTQTIVETLASIQETLPLQPDEYDSSSIKVFFLEVYGHGVAGGGKQYTSNGQVGYRMFDLAYVPMEVLDWERDHIASWRQHGGQMWVAEETLLLESGAEGISLVPRLDTVAAESLPTTIEATHEWLTALLPHTLVAMDSRAGLRSEGIVLRSTDRSVITKARFQNYERTLKLRSQDLKLTADFRGMTGMT